MNKGLKELKRLPKAIKDTFKDSFDIIKKELKEGEKNKQALEIIKKKKVNCFHLISWSLEEYNNSFAFKGGEKYQLSQEEYDLLREVLL